MADRPRHVIQFEGRKFANDYVFPAEIAALRAHRTGQFQERVILEWVRARKLKGIYMDVGAHIGNHTLFFAAFCKSTKVISIEGHPTISRLLKGNVKRNLRPAELEKVHVFENAAWREEDQIVQFAPIPRNNAGHTHIVNSGGRKNEKGEVQVTTTTIDFQRVPNLAVLKIDVEDVEKEVIEGGLQTIEKHRPLIIIERHDKAQLDETMAQLEPFGYKVVAEWKGVHTFALRAS